MPFWKRDKREPAEQPREERPAADVVAAPAATAEPQEPVEAPQQLAPTEPGGAGAEPASPGELEEKIVEALRTVYDPEIPVNIYELGLIYDLEVDEGGRASIKMTLTSPHCPVAESLPVDVQNKAASVPGVSSAEVDVVWDPAWNPEMMSEAAKLELGFF